MLSSTFFLLNDTATTEIYTLSLHDALPIFGGLDLAGVDASQQEAGEAVAGERVCAVYGERHRAIVAREAHCAAGKLILEDRKSTRLNSSHMSISYAVFCLKKKNN